MNVDYLTLVGMIIQNNLTLDSFIESSDVDHFAVEQELALLSPVAHTLTTEPKPIFFFKGCEYPNLNKLLQCSKLFAFAKGGSPYKESEISEYDTRDINPYMQVAVYHPEKKIFAAGLRFLPSYKTISFNLSAMSSFFTPTDEFLKSFWPHTVEFGQTFILPEFAASSLGGQYLFSAMAATIAINTDARFLCGKPTIEGMTPDIGKEIISSYARDAFNPQENLVFNPSGKDLLVVVPDVSAPQLRLFADIVNQYNEEISNLTDFQTIEYKSTMLVHSKRKIAERLLSYYGGTLPPMFKFYSALTEEKGLICLCSSIVNPTYTTRAWEFPILLDKTKITSLGKHFLDHYNNVLKDVILTY